MAKNHEAEAEAGEGHSVTVPLVIPATMRTTMHRVAALRGAQGRREGNRPYSVSALAREVFGREMDQWERELATLGVAR